MNKGNVRVSKNDGTDAFIRRHIGPGEDEISAMLESLNFDSLETLVSKAVPEAIRSKTPLNLPGPRTEIDVLSELRSMGRKNQIFRLNREDICLKIILIIKNTKLILKQK